MNKQTTKIIDECAVDFFTTGDQKHFIKFAKYVKPIIKAHAYHTCMGSTKWDKDDLFSILFADMWRLFKVYKHENNKKFHWLMLRQLKNKTINYIQNCTGRKYKTCFTCGTTQETKGDKCKKCSTSLKKPHATTGIEHYDMSYSHSPDYLKDLETKELVNIILEDTKKNNPVTHTILTMLLAGYSKSEISREVSIAQNALNNRILKCKRILTNIK